MYHSFFFAHQHRLDYPRVVLVHRPVQTGPPVLAPHVHVRVAPEEGLDDRAVAALASVDLRNDKRNLFKNV